ncbi:hypothetical protein CROQUDRAFT_663100 [Cronartium quercuum f. sp. fusiforme G11]|uniref:Potassium transporter n=1 Tax=Cronartium quercuum f. sp. fusiforme G11 TaxID=708437 RepID=A0A9P6ND69_9BASI|nr:hypothetical protein CROQUDRAFT_663100 [Cronartium quercuum f. sp. fusiforme G11]
MVAKSNTLLSIHGQSLTWTDTLDARYKKAAPSLLFTAFAAVGIIYGDIGTSPLYVLNGIFPADGPVPSAEDVLGAISAILWALTFVPLIKYSLIALEFGTGEGEGGPFALFSQLYPPEKAGTELALPSIVSADNVAVAATPFLTRRFVKPVIRVITLFAVALIISDGILTPAVSVSSAVSGIAIPAPSLQSNAINGISIAILVIIFFSQSFGTHILGMSFAPIVTVWLLLISGVGIYNITKHPAVFRAFDPSRAILYFVRVKDLTPLSGVLLAITGVEALFANLGQFSKGAIRLSFIAWIYPALVLAYLGQGAQLITNGEHVISNIFYQSIPGPTGGGIWWIVWIFGMLATIVASQAMITASFSLIQQMVGLKAFPPVTIVYTSDTSQGQIYAPVINFLLLIGTVGVTAGFRTNSSLTAAYGFAVAGVLISTTFLMMMVMIHVKKMKIWFAILFFLVTGFIDAVFFASTLQKVPHGAWFTLTLGCLIGLFLLFWTWAKDLEDTFDSQNRVRLSQLLLHHLPHTSVNLYEDLSFASSEHDISGQSGRDEPTKDADSVERPEIVPISPCDVESRKNLQSEVPTVKISDLAFHEEPEKLEFDEKGSEDPTAEDGTPRNHSLSASILRDTSLNPSQNYVSENLKRSSFPIRARSPSLPSKVTIAEPTKRKSFVNNAAQYPPIQSINTIPGTSASAFLADRSITAGIQTLPQRQASLCSSLMGTEEPGLRLNPLFLDGATVTGPLPRLECFSFFHHLGKGVGAPHAFTSLLKHQPALPKVIVFLSIRVVDVPHLLEEDKYLINKLRTLDALRVGYRDPLDLRGLTRPTLERIVSLERGQTPVGQNLALDSRIAQIVKTSENANHISQNFPETSNYIVDESKVLRIGVNAEI